MENGRVIKLNEGSKYEGMPLFYNNKVGTNFKCNALQGIQQNSKLSTMFFSIENVNNIQELIRYTVWVISDKKFIIDKQSDIEIQIVMRSTFLQHSLNLECRYKEQLTKLNQLVVNWCAPQILAEVQQYYGYLHDVENLPVPIDRAKNISNKGSKTLRSVTTTF